jgi:hypothetical protein
MEPTIIVIVISLIALLFTGGLFLLALLNYLKPPSQQPVVVQLGSEVEQPKTKSL